MRIAGLFAGIGGIEHGFREALGPNQVETVLLCENWPPAVRVLRSHFEAEYWHDDVTTLEVLPPNLDLLAAGFPCTDLSQAGRTAGIAGQQSGLVYKLFELVEGAARAGAAPEWLLIENVPNMLALSRGEAMRYLVTQLDALGYRWAYRVVDSRFTGVPQRRRRVILLASREQDPGAVLFADDAGTRPESDYSEDAFGFYWTEGLRGLGWAQDAVPTLKGGSTVGIPSPPAIWAKHATATPQMIVPGVEDAEVMQGFPRGWTAAAEGDSLRRNGPRYKLVGNAVTVGVAQWVASRLRTPGDWAGEGSVWDQRGAWPVAAYGERDKVIAVGVSEFPRHLPYTHLRDVVEVTTARPVSHRGIAGFRSRLMRGNLGRYPGFREAVDAHFRATAPAAMAG
ncbi:DNA cytosine methyltransferase [Couchioplanes azureus]|uniref:DNA cytosine methyltransferase n=1 Tax=Couchioplanes caeruleus TaxID=56438 RepID=UPI0019B8DBE8|nr:DNA (cytosine-5-)-methyltransferase [Couchioplanes caeruleus]GGQ44690.1 putative BsuMI modification methylase subunit YdiP [Couchioplanes caeruleus subsp. azureus]